MIREYDIEVSDTSDMTNQTISFYDFLTQEVSEHEPITENEIKMSYAKFIDTYKLDEDNHIHMITQDSFNKTDEIYFLLSGKYYMYDSINGILHCKNHDNLINMLKERMQVPWAKN